MGIKTRYKVKKQQRFKRRKERIKLTKKDSAKKPQEAPQTAVAEEKQAPTVEQPPK